MAYDKHTYTKGDILEASDLNHGEGGIDANDEGIAALQTALAAKAPLASPEFTGEPKAPTASAGTNNTQIATTAYAEGAVSAKTGTLSNLTTDQKGNLVNAINEVDSHADAAATAIGDMTDLETTATDLVGAANELKDKLDTLPDPAQNDGPFVITQHNGNMELTVFGNNAASAALHLGFYLDADGDLCQA